MKPAAATAVIAAVAAAIFVHVSAHRAPGIPTSSTSAVAGATRDCPECRRMADQIDALQANVAAISAQLAVRGGRPASLLNGGASKDSRSPSDPDEVQAVRAADAERRRTYMAGVAEAFARERVDGAWAGRTSVRVNAALNGDDVLRGFAHSVECRSQSCRVEIADDGAGTLSRRFPFVALSLADVLRALATEPVDPSSGHGGMVIYMSNQSAPVAADPK